MNRYNFKTAEENGKNITMKKSSKQKQIQKEKFYCLEMFTFSAKLYGHVRNYNRRCIADIKVCKVSMFTPNGLGLLECLQKCS